MKNPLRRKRYRVSFTTASAIKLQLIGPVDLDSFALPPMHSEWASYDSARNTAFGLAAAGYYDVAVEKETS